jgi:hypothetical protein
VSDDPNLNPWLGSYRVEGTDAYDKPVVEIMPMPPPPYYFWLGADAYPEWPIGTLAPKR